MSASLYPCLILDLETVPPKEGKPERIFMIGALRPDTGDMLEIRISKQSDWYTALDRLDKLSRGAEFVLGHNILSHDLPILQGQAPRLVLHGLPVIDTLRLSPLAFPQNPYHRLIKDYKLIQGSLNSPLADCRSAWALFLDQRAAFSRLSEINPMELFCYQSLLTLSTGNGLDAFFADLTEQAPLSPKDLKSLIPTLLRESDPVRGRDLKVCKSSLDKILCEDLRQEDWPFAYALAWLRVSGGNSVLAPWVRHQFPEVGRLIRELRDIPCGKEDCTYCMTTHDPRAELKRYFGFDDFRSEKLGQSLQHDIVLSAMRGENVLAILATGGGKSLCYQLPALNRFHRNGSLTVVISPLQSLMKDQVDGLLERNIQCSAALNGLLTLPERADVLEKIQMGDVGILFVSPEQFRNKAFHRAIKQRQIGAWIFDEAHCLSEWGNDFRPDYLYVARFIREFTEKNLLSPIGCFTATAKLDVQAQILDHFKKELGIDFEVYSGTPERGNLEFDVLPCRQDEKWPQVHALLENHIGGKEGGAVIFVSTRKNAETLSAFLVAQNWRCRYFHAGLPPHEKKDIQDDFKASRLQVIVATNAFGMGVDKADIRLVIHADIPGSLENYLQEAGRAGRDQHDARCVLLYDPRDIENRFGLSERARLDFRDIQQILGKLRKESIRRKGGTVVITAGEILMDSETDTRFSAEAPDAATRVITAVSWLERGQYLKREENHARIFPSRPALGQEAANRRLLDAKLSHHQLTKFRAILDCLYNAGQDERIHTDRLMTLTSLTSSEEVVSILKQMEEMGLLTNDSQLTVFLRHGIAGASRQRLDNALELEKALFKTLQEEAPDADAGDWQDLNLVSLTATLKSATEQPDLIPRQVLRLLKSLSHDHDGTNRHRSSFEMRQISREYFRLRIKDGLLWRQLESLGKRRRLLAEKFMDFLVKKLSGKTRGKDLLVETTFGELIGIIAGDLELYVQIPPDQRRRAVEHVLLYLHRQEILTLNHGMTVMRQAMTIEINSEKKSRYLKEDYQRLDTYYREKRIQVHVMREYAEVALKKMAQALQLVLDYFTEPREKFLNRYFPGRKDILDLATSEASWHAITNTLNNVQREVVTDRQDVNRLVLAGPGSGKTRLVVHRIAYLLRVRRVPADSIVALTFNRHAANEIRKRLFDLVNVDACGVDAMTYHSMAMRLTGTRFGRDEGVDETKLEKVLEQAVELLEGKRLVEGEDDLREQLLRGYRYILVDEYQDINELQYRLVSALAGRQANEEGRLCILAVGDDDQNIYAWRNTSNRYIDRFCEDYQAKKSFLIDNYRSSRHIIEAANQVIHHNPERIKAEYPIQIDSTRKAHPPGGKWESLDRERKGRVLRVTIPTQDKFHGNMQAQVAMGELERLIALEQGNWNDCAVLARAHKYLWPVQAWCEQSGIPYVLAAEKGNALPMTRQRDFVHVVERLRETAWSSVSGLISNEEWREFFETAFFQLNSELQDCQLSGPAMVDWLYEYARELRQKPGKGVYLGTVHSAKGLEFRHVMVLDGGWPLKTDTLSDERRLYYVGMTRAKETLTLCEFTPGHCFARHLKENVLYRSFTGKPLPELAKRYQSLGLKDIDMGYTGRLPVSAPIHAAIRHLNPGDPLYLKQDEKDGRWLLLDKKENVVGRTSKSFVLELEVERCDVAGILARFAEDAKGVYRPSVKCDRWEMVVPRLIGWQKKK